MNLVRNSPASEGIRESKYSVIFIIRFSMYTGAYYFKCIISSMIHHHKPSATAILVCNNECGRITIAETSN